MTRTLRKGNLQKNSTEETKLKILIKADNMSINQGYKKTEFVCLECGAVIDVDNGVLQGVEGRIHCPICVLKKNSKTVDDVEEISIDGLAQQVKKLTELSQQQMKIQQEILKSLGV